MPRYDYKCHECGHEYEEQHSMSEMRTECPKCKQDALVIVVGQIAYHNHYSPMHPRANRGRGH